MAHTSKTTSVSLARTNAKLAPEHRLWNVNRATLTPNSRSCQVTLAQTSATLASTVTKIQLCVKSVRIPVSPAQLTHIHVRAATPTASIATSTVTSVCRGAQTVGSHRLNKNPIFAFLVTKTAKLVTESPSSVLLVPKVSH